MTNPKAMELALGHHQAGRLAEAEKIYREILQADPNEPEALHLLGVIAAQTGNRQIAAELIAQALAHKPGDAHFLSNFANALKDLGRIEEAERSYRLALEIAPAYVEAHYNLAYLLQGAGRHEEAADSYRRALEFNPNSAEAHHNLGNVLRELGRYEEAASSYRLALALKPELLTAHNNLGLTLQSLGRIDEAQQSFRRALAFDKGYASAQKADIAMAHNNLGTTLQAQGRLADAEASYQRAMALAPELAMAHENLANIRKDQGRLVEAEASYRRALAINPDRDITHNNLANLLRDLGRLVEAQASYRRALELKRDSAEILSNLANSLQDQGRLAEAEAAYRRALAIKPELAMTHTNLLLCLSHNAEVDAETLFAEHCRFGEQFDAPPRASWPRHTNSREPDRCLQVGFVSADLRNHSVANFIEPLLAHLAGNTALSLHAYSNHVTEDGITQRLRGFLKHWHSVAGLPDAALADKIRDDGIDILIDLSGHSAGHRLLTFARKPAPLQASWMGYPGTTGLSAMDYFLSDYFLLPQGQFDRHFTEKIVRMPANASFLPASGSPPVSNLPALSNVHVTFGSFNHLSKLNPMIIALWARLLRALPSSRMVLGGLPQDGNNDTLIEWFAQEGVARERLNFHPKCDVNTYLALHHQVDICLDAFPYNGGTTTCYALWMGVPTLTLAGRTVPGRTGSGILGHLGLEDFIARDSEDFVKKGLNWADNLAALAHLRMELRDRFQRSTLGQPAVVAAGLERALRTMWRRWCGGLPAEPFDVSSNESTAPAVKPVRRTKATRTSRRSGRKSN